MTLMILLSAFCPIVCLAAAQNHLLSRQASNNSIETGTYKNPPQAINENQWPVAVKNPQWEGEFPIEGFDISKKYPGDSIDGWTVTVSVKSDIDAKSIKSIDGTDTWFNAATLRLNPPESLVKDALKNKGDVFTPDDSWYIEATRIRRTGPNKDDPRVLNADASCSPFLNSTCMEVLENAAAENFASQGVFGNQIPQDCKLEYLAASGRIATQYETWSDSIGNEEDSKGIDWYKGSEIQLVASDLTSEGNSDAINAVYSSWDMLLIVWGYDSDVVTEEEDRPMPKATLLCTRSLRQKNQDGEEDEKADNTNVGGRTEISFFALLVGFATALLLA